MREIKFRAFDKSSKTMRFAGIYDFDELSEWEVWERQSSLATNDSSKFDVMQFTGLQDKNGVDIYEGDVVRFLDAVDCSTESGYDFDEIMNIGKVYFCNQEHGWDLTNREQDKEDVFVSEDIEVTGNIHENPELLELNNE